MGVRLHIFAPDCANLSCHTFTYLTFLHEYFAQDAQQSTKRD